jgi:5'-methylthioinosine phosphorylase
MDRRTTLAVIGGSATGTPGAFGHARAERVGTPWGEPSAPVHHGRIGELRVLWLARHGEPHAIAPHRVNYRANLAALQSCGATLVLALNTVGGIADAALPGSLWLPDQLIDYSWGRACSFHDGERLPLAHVEFGEPYAQALRVRVLEAAACAGISLHDGGVYGCTQGPRLETAAEIRRMRADGCDLVGMTGMPEAALARELGLPYASLCMVVNRAAGLGEGPVTMEHILREAAGCAARVEAVLGALARSLVGEDGAGAA